MSLDTPELGTATVQPFAPGWGGLRRGAALVDRSIGQTCEAVGAMLVLAEVVILF
jgi:hypothetical protein